jgi:hypothetical protein
VSKPSKGLALTITSIEDRDIPDVIRLWQRAGLVREWNDPAGDIALDGKTAMRRCCSAATAMAP